MDSMVLRPAEGVDESSTQVAAIPWLRRADIGWWRGLAQTTRQALFHPSELMRGDRHPDEGGTCWNFAAWILLLTAFVSLGVFFIFQLVFVTAFVGIGGGLGLQVFGMFAAYLLMAIVGVLISLVGIYIWGLVVHGMLRMTGPVRHPMSGTMRALCYSTGAHTASAIPCLGWYFGWIWWLVSAVSMVRETHRISGGRAAFAVLTMPLMTFIAVAGAYAWFISMAMSGAGMAFAPGPGGLYGPAAYPGNSETMAMVNAYLGYAQAEGALPEHPLQLLLDDYVYSMDFVASDTTTEAQIVWPTLKLADLDHMTNAGRTKKIQAFVEELPENAIAHRVGDYVFTCPGIDPTTLSPDVWLVIQSPLPASGAAATGGPAMVHVGLADGSVVGIPSQSFQNSLQGQFTVRQNNNLPLLPKIESITHARPALSDKDDVED